MADDPFDGLQSPEEKPTPLNPPFQETFLDNTHTVNDMFADGSTYDPGYQQNWLQGVVGAANKAANSGGSLPKIDNYGFPQEATIYDFKKGYERMSPENRSKPPEKARPTRSEDPREVHLQWYRMMKEFGYNGGKQ